jgi:hypothetical protein
MASAIRDEYTEAMVRKASVVIEKNGHRLYNVVPKLKVCQSQGDTLKEAMVNKGNRSSCACNDS